MNFITNKLPRPIKNILKTARREFYAYFGTLKLKIKPIVLSEAKFLEALDGFENVHDFALHLKSRANPSFFINSARKDEITEIIQKRFPDSIQSTISQADQIYAHIFELLGSGPTHINYNQTNKTNQINEINQRNQTNKIDWHLDFKANRRWGLIHPKGINVDELDKPSDIKVPWELSRCQHFVTLGKAYWLTEDEKYGQEFRSEVESWIRDNPVGLGVNWLCTMDVAIRVSNWIWGWYFFKNSFVIDEKFTTLFLKSICLHGKYVVCNLENKGNFTSNHYLSDIVGLLYIAIIFPEFKESAKWREFAIQELKNEMQKQVNPDGMDFEGSTCYHRLVLELFFFSTLLTVINDDSFNGDYEDTAREIFGNEYVDRLCKMFEFVLYALKPNGKMPQIGDNDNGRLHIFSKKQILDMRYILNFGATFFNEPKFKIKGFGFTEDALWIFGKEGYKRWLGLPETLIKNLKSKAFPDSGIYVMRDKEVFIIVHCASNGQNGNGGHNHNDVLSFELNWNGQDLVVDPGTYNYTGDYKIRNLFRSSKYHNTVIIDKEEINRFNEREVFKMQSDARPEVLNWEMNKDYDILEVEHYGYKRLKNPVIHNREIVYCKEEKKIRIKDKFKGEGKHKLQWNLILSPKFQEDLNIRSKELKWQKEEAFYSPEYGVIKKTRKLTSTIETTIPYEAEFEISFVREK